MVIDLLDDTIHEMKSDEQKLYIVGPKIWSRKINFIFK